jgi:hypothetical protein
MKMRIFNNCCCRLKPKTELAKSKIKTKYRLDYNKTIKLILKNNSEIRLFSPSKAYLGITKNEVYDEIWNRICYSIIISLILLKLKGKFNNGGVSEKSFQLLEFRFSLDN